MASSRAEPFFRWSEGSRVECSGSACKIPRPARVKARAVGMTPGRLELKLIYYRDKITMKMLHISEADCEIGLRETRSLRQNRFARSFRQGIDETVPVIQRRGMASLAILPPGRAGNLDLL